MDDVRFIIIYKNGEVSDLLTYEEAHIEWTLRKDCCLYCNLVIYKNE
jgi:hypothetical protein